MKERKFEEDYKMYLKDKNYLSEFEAGMAELIDALILVHSRNSKVVKTAIAVYEDFVNNQV